MDIGSLLRLVAAAEFALLAALAIRAFRRNPDKVHRRLAISFGMLAATSVTAAFQTVAGSNRIIDRLTYSLFLWAGIAFLMFRESFAPLSRKQRIVAFAATGASTVAAFVAGVPVPQGTEPTAVQSIVAMAGLAVWCLCVGGPVAELWRASLRQPRVQRIRLEAMSAGFAAIVMILIVQAATRGRPATPIVVALRTLVLLLPPMLFVSVSPPQWLRRILRGSNDALTAGVSGLLSAMGTKALAQHVLDSAIQIVGGKAGRITTADGTVVASTGDLAPSDHRTVVTVPLDLHSTPAELTIMSGPYASFFGNDEVSRLHLYAAAASVAFERELINEELARQKTRYESLVWTVQNMNLGFVITRGGRLVHCNDAYVDLSGYSREELMAMGPLMEVDMHDQASLLRKDGHRLDLEVAVRPMEMGAHQDVVTIVRDVTGRKAAERELIRAYEKEKEAVERHQLLDEMRADFLSTVSHELRTPLTSVMGYAATLASRWTDLDDVRRQTFVTRILDKSSELADITNELIDFSRIEAGNLDMRLSSVGLANEVESSMKRLGIIVENRVVRLKCDRELMVMADRRALRRVVENLVTNAIKFSDDSSDIEITARAFTPDRVIISVKDRGIGIAPDETEKIFERFYRARRGDTIASGTGIGLAIVKEFVEAMGGKVWVESKPGEGSVFSFTLASCLHPAAKEEEKAEVTEAIPSSSG